MEKTGIEIMNQVQPTRLDALVREVMRACDRYTGYAVSYDRYGNKFGDENGLNAARENLERVIRESVTKLVMP